MRSPRELISLSGEFLRYVRGTDYFRQPQGLGPYFDDPRCYYNDLRGKADWKGTLVDGVPALYVAATGREIALPVMTLLYGIGSMDRYFLEDRPECLDNVRRTAAWLLANLLPEGYFDNHCRMLQPGIEFYSDNSAMAQGLALSFAVRAVQHQLVETATVQPLDSLLEAVAANMLRPMEEQGTALYCGDDLFLMEFCRKDHNVVLNGWIYAIFGLLDYQRFAPREETDAALRKTLATLRAALPSYRLPSGWSYYDRLGRRSSPFYQALHVALLDALHRLTGDPEFAEHAAAFRRADNPWNRARYALVKIKDKMFDKEVHCGQGAAGRGGAASASEGAR